jgi:hypothetical protein
MTPDGPDTHRPWPSVVLLSCVVVSSSGGGGGGRQRESRSV